MPIYEFACPKCRVVFNFMYKRPEPDRIPKCPRCGNKKMSREISRFAFLKGGKGARSQDGDDSGAPLPDFDDPRIERAMRDLEKDMDRIDENDPKQLAHLMRKMQQIMPSEAMPKELDVAIRRLEAGEDPEKIEEDLGDLLGDFGGPGGSRGGAGFARDDGLYDMD